MIKHLMARGKFFVEQDVLSTSEPASVDVIMTFVLNMASCRYGFEPNVVESFLTYPKEYFMGFAAEMFKAAKSSRGAQLPYRLMYAGFPAQVMTMNEAQLYRNAINHYTTGKMPFAGVFTNSRGLAKNVDCDMLSPVNVEDVKAIAKKLAEMPAALSVEDAAFFTMLVQNGYVQPDVEMGYRERIGQFVAAALGTPIQNAVLAKIKTPSDILRFAAAIGGDDVSLTNTKFHTKRRHRKVIADLVSRLAHNKEDFFKRRELWITLLKQVHIGEFFGSHDNLGPLVQEIRLVDTSKYSWNSMYDRAFKAAIQNKNEIQNLLNFVQERPGEMIRRVNSLHQHFGVKVMGAFKQALSKIPVTLKIQLLGLFSMDESPTRFVKGKHGTVTEVPKSYVMPSADREAYFDAVLESLGDSYANNPINGKFFVDPNLDTLALPTSQRSAATGVKTLYRGSTRKFNGDVVRLFINWFNIEESRHNEQRVDIDLSCQFLDENYKVVRTLAFNDIRSSVYASHSGDITDAPRPKGAAEFIDFKINELPENVAYVVMIVNSFTGQQFNKVEAFSGFMSMSEAEANTKKFDASKVVDRFGLLSEATGVIPMIYDVKNKQIIWCDNNYSGRGVFDSNSEITTVIKAATSTKRVTVGALLKLKIQASPGALLVNSPGDADVIYTFDEFLNVENVQKLLS